MLTTDDPLERLMSAMATGDLAALWEFHETFEPKLRAVVLANIRSMHRPDIASDRDRVDALTADAAVVIFDRAAGWQPGGAKPWNWAARAIRSMVAADIGHRSVELGNDDILDGEADAVRSEHSNGADLTIERLASIDPALTILEDAYRSVSSERDQQAAWLFRVQKVNGDPSPAHTVADEFGISPAYARKIHERHFARVRAAVLEEDRYRPLRALPWFAA